MTQHDSRMTVIELVDNKYYLGLMSCDQELIPERVHNLCKSTQKLYGSFKDQNGQNWIRYPVTVHELYAHLATFIHENGNRGQYFYIF